MKVQRWSQRLAIAALTCCFSLTATGCRAAPSAAGMPSASPSGKQVPVVIAARDIPGGHTITPDLVTVRLFDLGQAEPFSFRTPELVIGKYAFISIHMSQPITTNLLVNQQTQSCQGA